MTVFHIHHTAGRFTCNFHFVGDDHLSNVGFRQFTNDADDLGSNFRIKRCGRFIKQQHLRLHHQRAGNGHTLLLATGEMQWVAIAVRLQAQTFQQFFGTRQRLIFCQTQYAAGRFNQILHNREMRPKVVLLEDHAHVLTQLPNGFV